MHQVELQIQVIGPPVRPIHYQEIEINIVKFMCICALCLFVSACQTLSDSQVRRGTPTDQTFGHYHENLESNLILITMTTDYYEQLTQRQPVPVRGELPAPYAVFIESLSTKFALTRVANWPLQAIDVFCVVFEIQDSRDRQGVIDALPREVGVETAQLVQTFSTQAQPYNDPYLPLQHGVHTLQAISSHQWTRGKGVKIAVIDTGMDIAHSEFALGPVSTKNFVDTDDVMFRADIHGTAVGGVIAAATDNNTGMVGIAPDATLLALKACWHPDQNKTTALCNSLTLAKSLNYSIEQEVDVINLSLTGPPDPVLEQLVTEALAQGIIVIGAKPAHSNQAFPISIDGTIAVDMPGFETQAIKAPGRRVLSILPDEQYEYFDGSSFSTAHISGLAALLLGVAPTMTSAAMQSLLERTANPETGEVNACKAVQWVKQQNNKTVTEDVCI